MKYKKTQLITMGAMVGIGLLNPFTVAVLRDWFELVYTGIFIACTAWVVVYVLYKAFKPEPVNVPAKTAKTVKQKYLTI